MEKINIAELLKDCPRDIELDCVLSEDVILDGIDMSSNYPIKILIGGKLIEYFSPEGCLGNVHYTNHKKAKCVIFPKGKTSWEGFQRPFKDGDVVVADDGESIQLFLLKHLTNKVDNNGYCYFGWDFQFNELFKKGKYGFNRLATEEEKQKLFDVIKENGYRWNFQANRLEKLIIPNFKKGDKVRAKNEVSEPRIIEDVCDTFYTLVSIGKIDFTDQDNWELVPNKFDITTLKAFDKMLVRHNKDCSWLPSLFGFYDKGKSYPYICCNGFSYNYCIPYEGNEHLLGTTKDCDEYYKVWE